MMKTKDNIIFILLFSIPAIIYGQGKIEGKIYDSEDPDGAGLAGANIVWAGTTSGTSTNAAGVFAIKRVKETDQLVVSFIGYRTDTLTIKAGEDYIRHGLRQQNQLDEVIISEKSAGAHISRTDPILTVNITGAELCKAACCNLSESFVTNASVDVNYSDASTGAKQIQLLGLAGTYTQILTENIPSVYGLNTAYGLNYIPGPWMESIQISKGTSSVRNGYESMAGQINVEYKKPRTGEKFFANVFTSDAGRKELNMNSSVILSDRLSTMLSVHGELQNSSSDHNKDGFRDEPDIAQSNIFNRWDYMTGHFTVRTGIKILNEERIGGQFSYQPGNRDTWTNGFGIRINTRRYEAFNKIGVVFGSEENMSVGLIQSFAYHDQGSFYGLKKYDGTQKAYMSNLLFQWIPAHSKHTIDAGFSYKYDLYDEQLDNILLGRKESVPGLFAQYTFTDSSKMTLITGIRADFHNLYGTLITPRIHLRFLVIPGLTLRASAGKGYRAGNILAENAFLLASSRSMIIAGDIDIEEAWNTGFSLTADVPLGSRVVKLSGEVYRTSFINQVITDLDADVNQVRFYNLDGRSFSNVAQIEASTRLFEGFDLLAAWRWNDVRMTIDGTLREKPLSGRNKGLITASWLTHLRKWQYDYTFQFNGPGRIPSTAANPEAYRQGDRFGSYVIMNAQITRNFKKWNIYLGSENLTGFRQHNPIIASEDPFGEYFDSSLIWGPVHGRKVYAGLRIFFNRDV